MVAVPDTDMEAGASRHDGPSTMATDQGDWWEHERATFVRARLGRLSSPGGLVIDVGCGRGTMLDAIELTDRLCVSVDSHLWSDWKGQQRMFVVASAESLPFRTGCAQIVGSFDVLEHLPDDAQALAEQHRVVSDTGTVVAAVPADQRLWSAHDRAVGHFRRYSDADLESAFQRHGLTSSRVTYFFSYLWPIAWLLRNRPSRPQSGQPGTGVFARLVAVAIGVLAATERRLLTTVRLPFGTSLWGEFRRR